MLTSFLKSSNPRIKSLNFNKDVNNEPDIRDMNSEERVTYIFIKLKQLLDMNRQMVYIDKNKLFVVNLISGKVVSMITEGSYVINLDLTEIETDFAINLYKKLNLDLITLFDDFFIDEDIKVIYTGKAAQDYKRAVSSNPLVH